MYVLISIKSDLYLRTALLINQWESVETITCTDTTESANGTCAGLLPNGRAVSYNTVSVSIPVHVYCTIEL